MVLHRMEEIWDGELLDKQVSFQNSKIILIKARKVL